LVWATPNTSYFLNIGGGGGGAIFILPRCFFFINEIGVYSP